MIDNLSEHIVLPAGFISEHKDALRHAYHAHAEQARERYQTNLQILEGRWEDKEKARKLFESFSFTGAITLSEDEFNTLRESPLKSFIDTPSIYFKDRSRYQLTYGNMRLLRAEAYYQFFDRSQSPEQRCFMSLESLGELISILPQIQEYTLSKSALTPPELKIYLGYLDHLKIELLRLHHAQTHLTANLSNKAKSNIPLSTVIQTSLESVTNTYYSLSTEKTSKELL